MQTPGKDTDGDGRFDNWFGGRVFQEFKGAPLWHTSPFFQRAGAALLPTGDIRILIGSGTRDQIKDPNGGTCGLGNIGACIRKNCSVDMYSTKYRVGAAPSGSASGHSVSEHWTYSAGGSSLSV